MINNLYIKATPTTAAVTWGSITGTLSSQTDLQSALNAKQDTLTSGTNIKTLEGQSLLGSGNIDLTKSDVGLANVDNTSDLNKPISTATQTALNAKQATLVSGTNIKTINGNSVLGSGDLTIGASASWGGITGTLSSQTDLQTALNAKQNTLTLTTTGTSGAATLVGSTLNIPQYSGGGGGGGATGIHGFVTQSTFGVTAILTSSGTNTASPASDTLYTYPLIMVNDYTFNSIQIYCQSALVGGNCRILLYSNLNSNPDQKLYESTTIDLSTTGTKTITTTMTLTKGTVYWVVFHCGNGGAPLAVRSISSLTQLSLGYRSNNAPYALIQRNATAPLGSAPTTFGAYSPSSLNSPLVAFF